LREIEREQAKGVDGKVAVRFGPSSFEEGLFQRGTAAEPTKNRGRVGVAVFGLSGARVCGANLSDRSIDWTNKPAQ
jgi:hypothetical protein